MGKNKALVQFKGQRLIDRAIDVVEPLVSQIVVSSNASIPHMAHQIVEDEIKNKGPLGGLYSGLKVSENSINLIIPCDVPFVSPDIYHELLKHLNNNDAVVPLLPDGKIEPLVAVYHSRCLPVIYQQIISDDLKVVHLLEKLHVKYVKMNDSAIFKNINTPTDLW